MIGFSRTVVERVRQGVAVCARQSLSAERVVWTGLWPANKPRLILDGDWTDTEYNNAALGLLLKAEVGDTLSGPWRLWASIDAYAGRGVGAAESPWLNAPAPAAGTPTRFVVVPTGTVNAGLVTRGSAATWGRL